MEHEKSVSQKLDEVVGRAIRDKEFREQLIADPKALLKAEGLTDSELESATGGTNTLSALTEIFQGPLAPQLLPPPFCTEKSCNERG
jgi:hypothetical protein